MNNKMLIAFEIRDKGKLITWELTGEIPKNDMESADLVKIIWDIEQSINSQGRVRAHVNLE